MKQQIDMVIEKTARLQQIRARLATIEEEKAALLEETSDILRQIGAGRTSTSEWKDERLRLPRRIISFLTEHPTEAFRVTTIAHAFGLSHPKQVHAVRQALARLANERRVVRTGYGSYTLQPGAV